jgi:hypothetical protein
MMVTVNSITLQVTQTTYLQRYLRFAITKLICTYSDNVKLSDAVFDLILQSVSGLHKVTTTMIMKVMPPMVIIIMMMMMMMMIRIIRVGIYMMLWNLIMTCK